MQRENSQRNQQRSYIFRQNKLHLLNLTPSDLLQEFFSHLINSDLLILYYHLKTTSSPQCFQIFVSDAQLRFSVVQLSQTLI